MADVVKVNKYLHYRLIRGRLNYESKGFCRVKIKTEILRVKIKTETLTGTYRLDQDPCQHLKIRNTQ